MPSTGALDYESKSGGPGHDAFVEGETLWVPDGARLPAICVECGRQDDLVEHTFEAAVHGGSFTYFLCAADAAAVRRGSAALAVTLAGSGALSLAALIAARAAAGHGVRQAMLMLVVGLAILQLIVVCVLRSSRRLAVRGRDGQHLEVVGIEPALLPYLGRTGDAREAA